MAQPSSSPLYDTFQRIGLRFERGEGSWLYTKDGTAYLDFTSGIAVNILGHAHPHLVCVLQEQAGKLWHVSNLFEEPLQERLATRLVENSFADKVFFSNSGAEALECAIKTARRYHYAAGAPERYRIITFEGAFHGRTLATLAAGGQTKYLEGFGPRLDGFDRVSVGDEAALRAVIGPDTAAILIEPVQGESGIKVIAPEYLRLLRRLCDENGLLLIFDEVQCGLGRTAKLFAYQWSGVAPDIMAIAKGIGGGFPLGACLATAQAAQAMTPGSHGSTFGGNPLAMAVGDAVLDVVLEPDFLPRVRDVAARFRQGLAALVDLYSDVISEIRGEGLLLGMKCVLPHTQVMETLRQEHLLSVGAGDNVVRLLPPLNVTDEDMAQGFKRMETAFKRLSDIHGQRNSGE